MKKEEDGGFIALRGFAFQFDKALLEILKNPSDRYQIENIQDYNFKDHAVQVKYCATDYSKSQRKAQIKGFIIKLLKAFSSDTSKKYCIYAYYKGVSEEIVKLTPLELDDYLGKEKGKFTDELKQNFIANFKIIFAPDFKEQFNQIIENIKIQYGCSTDHAICYHAIMVSYLERLVIKYKRDEAAQRSCIKKDFDKLLSKQQEMIFRTGYQHILDTSKYHSILRKRYFNRRLFSPKERLFIIEPNPMWDSYEIEHILLTLAQKWTNNHLAKTPNNERCSPAFLVRTEENNLIDLKQLLYQNGQHFKDGYPFKGASFDPKQIHCEQFPLMKVDMFFVQNEEEALFKLKHHNRPTEVFQFYQTTPIEFDTPTRHISIKIDDTNDILEIA